MRQAFCGDLCGLSSPKVTLRVYAHYSIGLSAGNAQRTRWRARLPWKRVGNHRWQLSANEQGEAEAKNALEEDSASRGDRRPTPPALHTREVLVRSQVRPLSPSLQRARLRGFRALQSVAHDGPGNELEIRATKRSTAGIRRRVSPAKVRRARDSRRGPRATRRTTAGRHGGGATGSPRRPDRRAPTRVSLRAPLVSAICGQLARDRL
jgi:hypothetical protein